MPGGRGNLLQRLPEGQCPVGDGEFWSHGQPARLDVDQQLAPTLGALAHADLETDQFLAAFRGGADDHQHALGCRFQAGLQVDAVRNVSTIVRQPER